MSGRSITPLALALLLMCASLAHAQSPTPPPLDRTAQPQTTIADTVPPPPGVPNLAWLSSIEFEPAPADSLRRAFMSSFRGAFAEGAYATERERDGRPLVSVPVGARFRLIEGTSGWGVWNVQVVVRYLTADSICRFPIKHLRSMHDAEYVNGAEVVVAALSPAAEEAGARPIPQITRVLVGELVRCRDGGGPAPGQRDATSTWWRHIGRTTALLVLERLHGLSGDLDADTRFALGPARRLEPMALPFSDPPPRPKKR